ncbi:MAG: hypothetical protein JWL92_542 [Candidatus Nomurabacteria bacterium]|nr:hypothetical protein [Candidatus Nomurabacteria bacterium]
MKNIILIAVTGSNGAFKDKGCPLRNINNDYCTFFRNRTEEQNIVISAQTYGELPDKSPPYSKRDVYIISATPLKIDEGNTRTFVLSTVQEAMTMAAQSNKHTYIVADCKLYKDIYNNHRIDEIYHAIINEPYDNDCCWEEPSSLFWQPMPPIEKKPDQGRRVPGYEIVKYRHNPVM